MAKGFIIRERDAEAVLRALEVIRSALLDDDHSQAPVAGLSEPSPAPTATPEREDDGESDAARVTAASEYIASVDAGRFGRYKPQPRSKPPVPRYSDFIFLLAGDGVFSLADMAGRVRRYVQLTENSRKARSSLRTALDGDRRFVKIAPGRFQKRS